MAASIQDSPWFKTKICGDKISAARDAAGYFEVFTEVITNQNLTAEQIYNADETALYWKYVPRKTVATACEAEVSGFKDNKEHVTLLGCVNAVGSHRLKLALTGKSKKLRSLKNIKNLTVSYYANKLAWVNQELFGDW